MVSNKERREHGRRWMVARLSQLDGARERRIAGGRALAESEPNGRFSLEWVYCGRRRPLQVCGTASEDK